MVAIFGSNASIASWWPNLQLMQVAPSGGQICNYCKWRHLVDKFTTNARGVMLLLNLIQVTESISGSVVPLAMFFNSRPSFADSSELIWNDYIWLNWFEMFTFDWIGLKGLHLIELIWKFQISNWDVYIWLNWRQIIPFLQTAAGAGSTIQGAEIRQNNLNMTWYWFNIFFFKFFKVEYRLKVLNIFWTRFQ